MNVKRETQGTSSSRLENGTMRRRRRTWDADKKDATTNLMGDGDDEAIITVGEKEFSVFVLRTARWCTWRPHKELAKIVINSNDDYFLCKTAYLARIIVI